MTDQNSDTDGDNASSGDNTGADQKTFTQAELDRIVADRVSRLKTRYADYDDLKKRAATAMTEQERAVADAEQRGRTAALAGAGERLVRAEFRAAAAGRVDKDTLAAYLEDVNLGKFLGDDGEPDVKAIEARIGKLAGPVGGTDFDGGARTPGAKPTNMNELIRRQAGLG